MADRVLIVSTGLFAGVTLAVSLVAVPGITASTKRRESWQRVYDTGKLLVVPLMLTTLISGGLLYAKTPNPKILAATLIGGFPLPFTAIAMRSNINALQASGNNDPKVDGLVNTWAKLHNVRTAAGLVSFGLAVFALI
jgi:hypothetical protein